MSSSSSAVILPIFLLLAFNPQNVPNRINIKLAVSKNKEIPKIQKISGFLSIKKVTDRAIAPPDIRFCYLIFQKTNVFSLHRFFFFYWKKVTDRAIAPPDINANNFS